MIASPIPDKISPQNSCPNILVSPNNQRTKNNFLPKQKINTPMIKIIHPVENIGFA